MSDPRWRGQATVVAATLEEALAGQLSGVFVHGSAALGGWSPASDLDVLVTADAVEENWEEVGRHLLTELAPAPVVELSVVSTSAARSPRPPWGYLLHLNQGERRIAIDDGAGDPDLQMHYLVTRARGITIVGPSPQDAFGRVPRESVLNYLGDELAWALDEADQRYAVLNACRALAFAEDGRILSKVAGGDWALRKGLDPSLVQVALDAQVNGQALGSPTPEARSFVRRCIAAISMMS